ncbi:hypothetical protein NDU88_004534 [Pleurodeles waltl]|uniref:Uncharacterized protein n=1 Tax=Pleurodeles waltl TaxID=8319 RepID=A0AAV7WVM2_PLEWA|nr:hypothetical protein NDU88_004534 [Pleurodeles waltl]
MSACSNSYLLHEPESRGDPRNFVRHFIFSKPVTRWGTSPQTAATGRVVAMTHATVCHYNNAQQQQDGSNRTCRNDDA